MNVGRRKMPLIVKGGFRLARRFDVASRRQTCQPANNKRSCRIPAGNPRMQKQKKHLLLV